jgi:hypothetical protein
MSNIFKPNSRFAALADEIQESKNEKKTLDKKVQDKKIKENNKKI